MNIYENKYQKIVGKLIKKSFPLLKNKKIKIYEKDNLRTSADTRNFPFMRMRIHPTARKYNYNKLLGLFAHELCHMEYSLSSHFNIDWIKRISRRYNERETDKCAIRKGYAKQLYEQRSLRWKSKNKQIIKNKKFYLSPSEIKSYAKAINKW